MKLIAKKPCNFGKQFFVGDEIPLEAVLDPKLQENRGVLAIVDDEAGTAPAAPAAQANPVDTMTVVIHAEEGDMPLDLTREGLQAVVDVLTSNVEGAEPIVAQMTDGDALILLDMTDNRKTIKTAAKERAQELNAQESAGDQ